MRATMLDVRRTPVNGQKRSSAKVGDDPRAEGLGTSVAGPQSQSMGRAAVHPGARLGLTAGNTTRYSICPARGRPEQYEFLLYSVPSSTPAIPAGFSGLEIVTVLGSRTLSPATGGGGFKATYKRK